MLAAKRLLKFLPLLLTVPVVAHARMAARPVPGEFVAVQTLDSVFYRTQNLRAGTGVLAVGHPRLPATPSMFQPGAQKGVSYHRDLTHGQDGAGTIRANGALPPADRYSMTGCWRYDNTGSWTQRWAQRDGSWEKDAYRNRIDGTSTTRVETSVGIRVEMDHKVDFSGHGKVEGDRPGLPAKLDWNAAGDGVVTWADGTVTAFEDWQFARTQ